MKKWIVIFVIASSLASLIVSGYLFFHYYRPKPTVQMEFFNHGNVTYSS